jgi:hypothetical protein
LLGAVSARAIQLSVVLDVEVDDVYGSAAVVLDNLVGGVVRTTANDPGLVAGNIFLDGDGVFTDILEPDELECTGALTVDTLGLILADDAVAQGCTFFQEENGIRRS